MSSATLVSNIPSIEEEVLASLDHSSDDELACVASHRGSSGYASIHWAATTHAKRLVATTFTTQGTNSIDILDYDGMSRVQIVASTPADIPCCKAQFTPDGRSDVFISVGEYLSVWNLEPKSFMEPSVEEGNSGSRSGPLQEFEVFESCRFSNKAEGAPTHYTGCDWATYDPNVVLTCSIDTTVTLWDLPNEKPIRQLVAHDKAVFGVEFYGAKTFVSCSEDGSIRLFDLRTPNITCQVHCESQGLQPIIRVAVNPIRPEALAAILDESSSYLLMDLRKPDICTSESAAHVSPINCITWSGHANDAVLTGGEDRYCCVTRTTPMPSARSSTVPSPANSRRQTLVSPIVSPPPTVASTPVPGRSPQQDGDEVIPPPMTAMLSGLSSRTNSSSRLRRASHLFASELSARYDCGHNGEVNGVAWSKTFPFLVAAATEAGIDILDVRSTLS